MSDVVVFGGTSEGRELAGFCDRKGISATVCVATAIGGEAASAAPGADWRVGRLDSEGIARLLGEVRPKVVVDATHPYATEVTANLAAAAGALGLALVRVVRPAGAPAGLDLRRFDRIEALVEWLNTTTGVVFAAIGASQAEALTRVDGFAERVYLRLLPVAEGIERCARLGFGASRLIAMQGPFGEDLNRAMFRQVGASILVTKDSGPAGGLEAKLAAAAACGLVTALLERPGPDRGVSLETAQRLIVEAAG